MLIRGPTSSRLLRYYLNIGLRTRRILISFILWKPANDGCFVFRCVCERGSDRKKDSLSLSLALSLSLSLTLSLSRSPAIALSLLLSPSRSLALSLSHTVALALSLARSLALSNPTAGSKEAFDA